MSLISKELISIILTSGLIAFGRSFFPSSISISNRFCYYADPRSNYVCIIYYATSLIKDITSSGLTSCTTETGCFRPNLF
jgi:hypothetical protein